MVQVGTQRMVADWGGPEEDEYLQSTLTSDGRPHFMRSEIFEHSTLRSLLVAGEARVRRQWETALRREAKEIILIVIMIISHSWRGQPVSRMNTPITNVHTLVYCRRSERSAAGNAAAAGAAAAAGPVLPSTRPFQTQTPHCLLQAAEPERGGRCGSGRGGSVSGRGGGGRGSGRGGAISNGATIRSSDQVKEEDAPAGKG